ncbi:MAG: prepilin peptidase [Roseburia sp.]
MSTTYIKWCILLTVAFLYCCTCYQVQQYSLHELAAIELMLAGMLLGVAAIIDGFIHKIPNFIVAIGFFIRLLFFIPEWICYEDFWFEIAADALAMILFFVIFLLVSVITKHGFGMGDVKLICALGFWVGTAATFYTLAFGMFYCMLTAIGLLLLHKKTMKDYIPFGPFVFAGYLTAMFLNTF